ncbi:hypothetical protein KBC70_01020 [Candidatus Woesebacteria bacterium]|nr:hypothetical protein [Candidatus Woesebacteria bacterium]
MVRIVQRKKSIFIKRFWLIIFLILIFVFAKPYFTQKTTATPPPANLPTLQVLHVERIPEYSGRIQTHLFVPYWRLNPPYEAPKVPNSTTTTIMYFAIHPNSDGTINTSEPGYTNLASFIHSSSASNLLTVSMQNEEISSAILENSNLHTKLASKIMDVALQHNFDGIVLDLEYAALPTKSVITDISAFTKTLSEEARAKNLSFSITLYGDTYYRSRPYDVKTLATYSDYIYIMVYDFHKSYGLPGPNFPLSLGSNKYEYSLESALDDFLKEVPTEKLIVTYGMFGYDWSVDDQNRPAKAASARTLNQLEAQFFPNCTLANCKVTIDPISAETNVTYSEENGQKHAVWFENERSLNTKISKMRTFGIQNVGIWAAGYYDN